MRNTTNCLSLTINLDGDEFIVDIYPKEVDETFTLDGITLTLAEWSFRLGITERSLRQRLRNYIPEVALDNAEYASVTAGTTNYNKTVLNGKSLYDWATILGISCDQLRARLKRYATEIALDNGKFREAVEENRCRRHECNGKSLTIREWSIELGITYSQVLNRLGRYVPEIALDNDKYLAAVEEKRRKRYEYGGESLTAAEWAAKTGLSVRHMAKRLSRLPVEEAISAKSRLPAHIYTYDGKSLTAREWAIELKVNKITFQNYVESHSIKDAVERFKLKKEDRKRKRRNAEARQKARKDNDAPDYPYLILNAFKRKSLRFTKLPERYAKLDIFGAHQQFCLTGDGERFYKYASSILRFYFKRVSFCRCTAEDVEDAIVTTLSILMRNTAPDKFECNQHILNYLATVGRHRILRIRELYERTKAAEYEYAYRSSKSRKKFQLISPIAELTELIDQFNKFSGIKFRKRTVNILKRRASGLILEEVASIYRITRERVRQIETKAIKQLREFLSIQPEVKKPKPVKIKPGQYEYSGRAMSLAKWAEEFGIYPTTLSGYAKEVPVELLLERMHNLVPGRRFTYLDESLTVEEWAKRRKCPVKVIRRRLVRYPIEKALEPRIIYKHHTAK